MSAAAAGTVSTERTSPLVESLMFIAIFFAAYPLVSQIVLEVIHLLTIVATTNIPLLDYDGDGTFFADRLDQAAVPCWKQVPYILVIATVLMRDIRKVWIIAPLTALFLGAGEFLLSWTYFYIDAYRAGTMLQYGSLYREAMRTALADMPEYLLYLTLQIGATFAVMRQYEQLRTRYGA